MGLLQPGSLQSLALILIEDSDGRLGGGAEDPFDGTEMREGPGAAVISVTQALHFQSLGIFLASTGG